MFLAQDWINNLMSLFKSGMLKRVRSHLIANVLFAVLVYSLYVQVCVCVCVCVCVHVLCSSVFV